MSSHEKTIITMKWLGHNFHLVATLAFIYVYLRWFCLTPLELDTPYYDPNEPYIVGLILLCIYILFAAPIKFIKNRHLLKVLLKFWAIVFLGINITYAFFFQPQLAATANCNDKSYYVSNNFGTPTEFRSYDYLTVWKNNFKHETIFFGYGNTSYQIVCDEEQNEVNIIIPNYKFLDYTYGEHPRRYLHISASLDNQLFFVSEERVFPDGCDKNGDYWECDLYIYTLYKCNSDYKSCNALPLQYSKKYYIFGDLVTNEKTKEVYFYNGETNNPMLIFTYGKHPRCYAEGCKILEEPK